MMAMVNRLHLPNLSLSLSLSLSLLMVPSAMGTLPSPLDFEPWLSPRVVT